MLFQPKPTQRYDGIISATFINGKLDKLFPNSLTNDMGWLEEIQSILTDLSELYPDSGMDGLSAVADEHFYDDAKPLFWEAINKAGIVDDRDACEKAFCRATVINMISIIENMYRYDE